VLNFTLILRMMLKPFKTMEEGFHDICPEQFIVKVPYTAEGLIGARLLKDSGVKINFTLGFSARENVLVTRVSRPDYVNVFLGRIGAYMIDNKLGDGSEPGRKAVISSQNWGNRPQCRKPMANQTDSCKPQEFQSVGTSGRRRCVYHASKSCCRRS